MIGKIINLGLVKLLILELLVTSIIDPVFLVADVPWVMVKSLLLPLEVSLSVPV